MDSIKNLFRRAEWRIYKEIKRMRLKNRNATVISSNCNGEFIYYDMRLRFMSPTINLSFEMNDYVKMLEALPYYLSLELIPNTDERYDFPTGMLGDIEILFNHYKTFEEAKEKWDERKKRIDPDNIFVLGTERDGCTYETLKRFDALPYKNKVIFTHIPYPEISSAFCISGFENDSEVGILLYFRDGFFIRRYLDEFDYVSFLDGKPIKRRRLTR